MSYLNEGQHVTCDQCGQQMKSITICKKVDTKYDPGKRCHRIVCEQCVFCKMCEMDITELKKKKRVYVSKKDSDSRKLVSDCEYKLKSYYNIEIGNEA